MTGAAMMDAAFACSPASNTSTESSPTSLASAPTPTCSTKPTKAKAKGKTTSNANATTSAPLDSDPIKRARRTAIERRSRQQRQARVKLLQDEVTRLTTILENLTLPRKLQDNARSLLDNFGLVPAHTPPPKVLVTKMESLAKEMRALERAHRQMQQRLYEHQHASAVMRDLVLQPAPDDWSMNIKQWDAISKQHYKPLSRDDCAEIIESCMKTIRRFSLSDDFVSSGLSLNGWVDRTRFEPSTSTLEFSFSKHLPYVDPATPFDKYWNIFWNESEYRRVMLGLQTKYHMHILQRISDDIVILRQDIKYPALDTTCHHICIQFRQSTPTGYLCCMRTIPMPSVQLAMPDVIWTQNFLWNHSDKVTDRQGNFTGTTSTACGSITSENAAYASIWIMEAAVTVLRVESALVAPLIRSD